MIEWIRVLKPILSIKDHYRGKVLTIIYPIGRKISMEPSSSRTNDTLVLY